MTDGLQGLREDVAFLRDLAEQGRSAPLLGGSVLVAAGAVFAPASLAHWAVMSGRWDVPASALGVIWLAAAAVFLVALFTTKSRMRHQADAASRNNQTAGAVWTGVGLASFALWGAFMLASVRTGEFLIMDMFAVIILALYGAAFSVAGAISGQAWLKAVAGAAMLLAVGLALLVGTAEQYLVYALALLLVALVPGLIMMRQARRTA